MPAIFLCVIGTIIIIGIAIVNVDNYLYSRSDEVVTQKG